MVNPPNDPYGHQQQAAAVAATVARNAAADRHTQEGSYLAEQARQDDHWQGTYQPPRPSSRGSIVLRGAACATLGLVLVVVGAAAQLVVAILLGLVMVLFAPLAVAAALLLRRL